MMPEDEATLYEEHPMLVAVFSCLMFVIGNIFHRGWTDLANAGDEVIPLPILAIGSYIGGVAMIGTLVWRSTRTEGMGRPLMVSLLGAGLAGLLFAVAKYEPQNYFSVMTGVIASVILALAAGWMSDTGGKSRPE